MYRVDLRVNSMHFDKSIAPVYEYAMGAAHHVVEAERTGAMNGWRGLHVGGVPCYRDAHRHASWRWGHKKGLRRARRRLGRAIVRTEAGATVEVE